MSTTRYILLAGPGDPSHHEPIATFDTLELAERAGYEYACEAERDHRLVDTLILVAGPVLRVIVRICDEMRSLPGPGSRYLSLGIDPGMVDVIAGLPGSSVRQTEHTLTDGYRYSIRSADAMLCGVMVHAQDHAVRLP